MSTFEDENLEQIFKHICALREEYLTCNDPKKQEQIGKQIQELFDEKCKLESPQE